MGEGGGSNRDNSAESDSIEMLSLAEWGKYLDRKQFIAFKVLCCSFFLCLVIEGTDRVVIIPTSTKVINNSKSVKPRSRVALCDVEIHIFALTRLKRSISNVDDANPVCAILWTCKTPTATPR